MIKVGLIGCGRISEKHFDVYQKLNDRVKLISVCDIEEGKAKEASTKYGVSYYIDYKEMLEKSDIDLVSICTPSGIHPKIGIEAAKRKIHVLTEKPMATRLHDADALIHECDNNNVHLFVVKQNRLNPGIQLLKNAIDKGRFGRLYFANATVFWTRPQNYYDMAKWRGTWEFDGGAFMNQASHYIDIIQWLMGPVERVSSFTGTLARHIEAEDTGASILKFRNGAMGVIQVTMLTYPKNWEGSITIIGEKGTAKIGGLAVNRIEKWEFSDYDDDDKSVLESNYEPKSVYGFGHIGYYKNVFDVLESKAEPEIDGRSGRKSLELILAFYESAKRGKSIALPFEESN